MPRRIPGPVSHEFPEVRGARKLADSDAYIELECPNDERIADIERRLAKIEAAPAPEPVTLPAVVEDRGQPMLAAQVATLREEIAELKSRPHLSQKDINDLSAAMNSRVVNIVSRETEDLRGSLADLVGKMTTLAEIVHSKPHADNAEPHTVSVSVSEQTINDLAHELADVTATVMKMFSMVQGEVGELRRRINKQERDHMDMADELHSAVKGALKGAA